MVMANKTIPKQGDLNDCPEDIDPLTGFSEVYPNEKIQTKLVGKEVEISVQDSSGLFHHIGRIFCRSGMVYLRNDKTRAVLALGNGENHLGSIFLEEAFLGEDPETFLESFQFVVVIERDADGTPSVYLRAEPVTYGTFIKVSDRKIETPVYNSHFIIGGGRDGSLFYDRGKVQGLTENAGGIDKGYKCNQDGIYINPVKKVIAVADGMGGYKNGEVAALLALQSVDDSVQLGTTEASDYFYAACQYLRESGLQEGGATMALAKISELGNRKFFQVGNVGDAKVLVYSPVRNKILYASRDQSVVQDLIDLYEELDPVVRYTHSMRHLITNCISSSGMTEFPLSTRVEVLPGDIAFVCSDGISDFMSDDEIAQYLKKYGTGAIEMIRNEVVMNRHGNYAGFDTIVDGKRVHVKGGMGDNIGMGFMVVD